MADVKQGDRRPEELLVQALELLDDVQFKLGMFENQRYQRIKLSAEKIIENEQSRLSGSAS